MSKIKDDSALKFTPKELRDLLLTTIPHKLPVLICGKPGQGKTSIVEWVIKSIGADLILAHPVVDDPTDYKGLPAICGTGKYKEAQFLPFGDLKKLIDAEKLTVHFGDDLGQAMKSVQAAYMQLMLSRQINGHKVSPHVVFVAATNRKEDKAGVQGILEPLKDRFATVVELISSLDDWVEWAIQNDVRTEVIAYVRMCPGVLDDFEPSADLKRSATPRGLEGVSNLLKANLPQRLQYKSFAGAIGEPRAAEFVGFLRIYEQLPDLNQILDGKQDVDLPKDASARYAICQALAARATNKNFENIITYVDRMQPEFSVLTVRDAISYKGHEKLAQSEAFIKWVTNHKDILV